ncbi:hypothetical protein CEXT_448951 [Caerostris extrusa]|uniref:Uncharacterized protein n=1 Tax=Caerostris extrusa TaxID=172846 RepID=A0AAV4XJK4_CAEEX|nr:hypothetical protein CEXT_448951 [Caerostris extrusa]
MQHGSVFHRSPGLFLVRKNIVCENCWDRYLYEVGCVCEKNSVVFASEEMVFDQRKNMSEFYETYEGETISSTFASDIL